MTKLLLTTILATILAIAGTASADVPPDPRCLEIEGVIVGQDEVGMTNGGLRIDVHMEGQAVEGLLAGSTGTASARTIFRHDGVTEFDIRLLMTDRAGGTIAATVIGYQRPAVPMSLTEMLNAMVDLDYAPPDVYGPLHGAAWFEPMAPEYAVLNHHDFAAGGEAKMATGHMWVTHCPIAPERS